MSVRTAHANFSGNHIKDILQTNVSVPSILVLFEWTGCGFSNEINPLNTELNPICQ